MRYQNLSYDVVIVGGGLAGYCAAIAAARGGASTCLIQDRPVLGGNSSSEIRVTPHGAGCHHPYGSETGIISEVTLVERAACHVQAMENSWTNSQWDMALYDLACRTEGLTMHMNTSCDEVILETNNGELIKGSSLDPHDERVTTDRGYMHRPAINPGRRIQAIEAQVAAAETRLTIIGKNFIDCSGDGVLAHLAGCEWRWGSEGQDEFNELHAPTVGNALTMGNSIQFLCRDVGEPVPYQAPPWAKYYDDDNFFWGSGGRAPWNPRGGFWWIEIGVPFNIVFDNEKIRHELTAHALGVWDWMKNRDERMKEQCANYVLDWIGQVPGKRESRRIMGKHLINENELHIHNKYPDEVAYGGWFLDLHTPGGLLAETGEPMAAEGYGNTIERSKGHVGPYGLPLSALISKDIDNLGMAGRNISCTKAALGSIRVMNTTALLGQAIGTAAAHAQERDISLNNLDSNDIGPIQQRLLREAVFLPHTNHADETDLIPQAKLSCSSELLNAGHHSEIKGTEPLGEDCLAQLLAVDGGALDTIRCCFTNPSKETIELQFALRSVDNIWDYSVTAGEELAQTSISIPPGDKQWIEWPVALVSTPAGYLRLEIASSQLPKLIWHHQHARHALRGNLDKELIDQPGLKRMACGTKFIRHRQHSFACQLSPAQHAWSVDQIRTSYNRPFRSTSFWRPSADDQAPQLTATWDQSQRIQQIEVQFTADLIEELSRIEPLSINLGVPQAYRIQAYINAEWQDLVVINHNVHQQRIHQLPEPIETTALRITINKATAPGISTLRAYRSPSSYSDPWEHES